MIPGYNEWEALQAAKAELEQLNEKFEKLVKYCKWQDDKLKAAQAEFERLKVAVENANHIRDTQREMRQALEKQNEIYRTALSDWLTWEQDQIRKDGPYVGKQINELIQQGLNALKAGESK